jgi:hypothetical protein
MLKMAAGYKKIVSFSKISIAEFSILKENIGTSKLKNCYGKV